MNTTGQPGTKLLNKSAERDHFAQAASRSSIFRERRSKSDWAGFSLGDAFKANLEYYLRMPAQQLFYRTVKKAQLAAAQMAGFALHKTFEPAVKPQLSPCYTTYPSALAAYAAVGLTGFLEFEARVPEKLLVTFMEQYLENPAKEDRVKADPDTYKKVAAVVVRCVQTRLLREELSRVKLLFSIEIYRLFSASQQNMKFASLAEIIHAVVLYGDVLPDWQRLNLHPLTRRLLRDLSSASAPFFAQLGAEEAVTVELGTQWARALCRCLAIYLVRPQAAAPIKAGKQPPPAAGGISRFFKRFADPESDHSLPEKITPLDAPQPPALFDPPTVEQQVAQSLLDPKTATRDTLPPATPDASALDKSIAKALTDFAVLLDQASGQDSEYEDMRSDLLEHILRDSVFAETPIQGSPAEGHEVQMRFGDEIAGGEIFDRPVELSEDFTGLKELLKESQPTADAMRSSLYPNVDQIQQTERLRTSGAIDPARLAIADVSPAIFRRYRIIEKADRRGRPVLLIACDGSGSLNRWQMRMAKVLVAAWLDSTTRSQVQILAGLYHSGQVRPGVSGPLIQWMYHPRKTPAISRKDAVRALVSLPDVGTGVQSDVLSIAFMLQEARRLARGKMVYFILITDCEWNRSLNNARSGYEEVYSLFEGAYAESAGKLHTTLVALGVEGKTRFEELVDRVIVVPGNKLQDHAAVAALIGVYVASCMRERRRKS